ncbi:hypothetical protein CLOSTMETH_02140 [[Clostridium] methylpentosum DSM 5476]|uniref:Helix-turn-helix domain-containing protein n=1 Tax=[Clostridium] methylpentosum DSM 5476 TaxID=537013 RepID=C0EE60_9FIRM|nr:hypothetical protein CLOSTMETH_02140 [[Clostridium] methylpentosum DSM 5476]MDY3988474.1 DNA-binding protein [Massilioclostridium sp.]
MVTATIPRMRGIKEAIAELKAIDPQTAVTETYLRRLIKSGGFPAHHAGKKILINFDLLLSYLSEPALNDQSDQSYSAATSGYGTIRKVEAR